MNIGQILLFVLAIIAVVIYLSNKVEINHPKFNEIKDWIKLLLIASWLGLASYLIMVPSLFN